MTGLERQISWKRNVFSLWPRGSTSHTSLLGESDSCLQHGRDESNMREDKEDFVNLKP